MFVLFCEFLRGERGFARMLRGVASIFSLFSQLCSGHTPELGYCSNLKVAGLVIRFLPLKSV